MVKIKERLARRTAKGFTLIELLVVIAIIGILAAVILASLGTARSKGNDAKVKEQMAAIRNAAEIYYAGPGNYGKDTASGDNICNVASTDTSGMYTLLQTASWPDATAPVCSTDAGAATAATKYSAYHDLSTPAAAAAGSKDYWCVDSTGASKSEPIVGTTKPSGGGACP